MDTVRQKIYRYCAYQERCHSQVRAKLSEWGLWPGSNESEELITELITQGFLNEERFARSFAGGKFRMKQWGKRKIRHELEQLGLTNRCIESGLSEIDAEAYQQTLNRLMQKRWSEESANELFLWRDHTAKYLIQKGFEPDLVWATLKNFQPA